MIKRLLGVVALLTVILPLTYCDQPTTVETPYGKLEPGRRDYEWTLYEDQDNVFTFPQMKVLGPNNIFATEPDDKNKPLYHWDGSVWTTVNVGTTIRGAWGLCGSGENDLYIGNIKGELFHYNGQFAEKIATLEIQGYSHVRIHNMWQSKSGEIYLCGYAENLIENDFESFFYKYNEGEFTRVVQPITQKYFVSFDYDEVNKRFIICGSDNYGHSYIYKVIGSELTQVSKNKSSSKIKIGDEIYAFLDHNIYQISSPNLDPIIKLSNYNLPSLGSGTNYKNIFTNHWNNSFGEGAGLAHYNGENLEVLYPVNANLWKIFSFKNEIVAYGIYFGGAKSFMLHGKLKD